jgi:folate-binding protein YgfZ
MFWTEVPRDVVQVRGPDAAAYLQSQVSNDLRPLAVGGSVWAFLLQPNGRIDVLARIWRAADDTFVLDTDAGFGEVLAARLRRFKIRVKADVEPLGWRCVAVRGRGGDGLIAWGDGYDLLGESPAPPAGVPEGTAADLLDARIEAVWPAMGSEIEPGESVPAETGITSAAVSFTKGCYPGQELVERMDSRGATAPRLLQRVDVAETTRPGDDLVVDGTVVGSVTSVGRDGRALAFVKRGAVTRPLT